MKKLYSVTKHFEFEACHRLFSLPYESQCKNIHGHTYKVNITITTNQLNNSDMVIDFTHLKSIKNFIDDKLDHSIIICPRDTELINIVKNNPDITLYGSKCYIMPKSWDVTAERFADLIAEQVDYEIVQFKLKKTIHSIKIDVFETTNNKASVFIEY